MKLLEIKNIQARVSDGGKEILRGVNLSVGEGEVHVLMGPNGSGKSTLSAVLTGSPQYEVTDGSVTFRGKDLLAMSAEDRSREGLFLSFQNPVEIPGVSMVNFMRSAVNAKRAYNGEPAISASEFLKIMRQKRDFVELDSKLASRSVNEGFSGGEKKRNEIFQMVMLEPHLAILDEADSGLDVDAIRIVAKGVESVCSAGNSVIIITHNPRLLELIHPDFVHVLYKGKVVESGDYSLAVEIGRDGFERIKKQAEL